MHTREIGILDSRRARAIRVEFETALQNGASAYAAADSVLLNHAPSLHDSERGPEILYALAALQLEHGVIAPKLRKRVLTLINSGDGLESWAGAAPEIIAARKEAEQELRARLIAFG